MNFQAEKNLIRDYYTALDRAQGTEILAVLERHTAPDYRWRGYHPFAELSGIGAVAETFWIPLKAGLSRLQRRQDIFFAGKNEIDGFQSIWVVSMGHLMGLFDAPWLGISPTGKIAMLRYCEFNRVEAGRIAETAFYFDLPHLMVQAGQNPFGAPTGANLVQPGPMNHAGLLFADRPAGEGRETLRAINRMIDDIAIWTGGQTEPLVEELRRSWHDDMIWWGPTGIGASYTIERYAEQHAGPFRAAFAERAFKGHICRIAEGHFGGFFGWPNLTLKHSGGFMGMPATGEWAEMRVIDIYRREGSKLSENWVFIDLLHFWKQQGVDLLERAVGLGISGSGRR